MKKANKLLSLLLTVVMLVQLIQVPLSASAVEYIAENETESVTDSFTLPDEYTDGVYSESNNTASKIIEEDPELREENVKHFRCENGSYIAASYPYPVHYEKDGVWKDIDNTLVPVSSYALDETDALNAPAYFTNGGLFEATFPNVLSENSGITIQFGDTPLQMGMLSSSSEEGQVQQHTEAVARSSEKGNLDFLRLDNLTSRIVYPDALPDTDVEYIVTPTGMKENIIIKKTQEIYSYEYFISNENISLILNEDKSVSAFNEDGQLLYTIESPYMYDSMGEESYEIAVDLIEEADGYRLTYNPETEWINYPQRQFPVTVDPSIIVEVLSTKIYDCSVNPTESTAHPYAQFLSVGYNKYDKERIYLKFNLPALPDCSVVTNAQCGLSFVDYDTNGKGGNFYINAYEVGRDWATGSTTDPSTQPALVWNTQKDWTFGPVLDYRLFKQYTLGEYCTWNITSAVKKWYEEGENTGITLQANYEEAYDSANVRIKRKIRFFSSDKNAAEAQPYPLFTVSYMNNAGLEGYWTYHSIDSGRSGLTSINDYNGELVHIHQDISMSGNRMPIGISHVYNLDKTNSSGTYGSMKLGDGWRLNLNEEIIKLASSDLSYKNDCRYKLIDEDGTAKYFIKTAKSTEFAYEYNDKLILTVSSSSTSARYTISDETGNKKIYDSNGRLVKFEDANGNVQTVTYTNSRISKVTDPVGREVVFGYDTDGQLVSLKDPSNRETKFEYSDGKLVKIVYPDSKTTQFLYNENGNMSKVIGIDNSYAEFDYKAVSVPGKTSYRTQAARFYGTEGGLQDCYTYTFTPSATKVQDNFGHSETMSFDSAGRTVCVVDENGRAFYGDYNKSGNKNNTLKYQSDMQQTITNLVKNSGAETGDGTGWYINGSGAYDGNYRIDTEEKAHGTYSFKLYSAANGRINYRQDLTIEPGKTYTLSALVKTKSTLSGDGAFLGLVYQKGNGSISYVRSDRIKTFGEWERYSVTFEYPDDYTSLGSIMLGLDNSQGTVWFDDIQLEEGAVANRYNMLSNGSMETVKDGALYGWLTENCVTGDGITEGRFGNGYTMIGDPDKVKSLYQEFPMDGKKGDTIVAGAWAKSNSVLATPEEKSDSKTLPKDDKKCMISVTVTYKEAPEGKTDKEVTDRFEFPSMSTDWQYISHAVTALGDYEKVKIALEYRYNMNTVVFDDADFYIDTYGTKYEYDDSGKITSEKDSAGQEYKYTYEGPDLKKIEFKKDGETKEESNFTYDKKHNLIKEVSDAGVITEYTYGENGVNTFGNVTKTTIKNADGTLQTASTCEYTADYNYQTKITDARGKSVTYQYDTVKGLLQWSRDALGNQTDYAYDEFTDALISSNGSKLTGEDVANAYNQYEYNNDVLQKITTLNNTYEFTQDQFGRPEQTKIGTQVLTDNEYNPNGTQKKLTYGNGDTEESVYNKLDQVIADKYNGIVRYEWQYGLKGQIGLYIDHINNVSYRYEYDLADRLSRIYATDGSSLRYTYDDKGNVSKALHTFTDNAYAKTFSTGYVYGDDNRITQVHFDQNNLDINRTYDDLGRVTNHRLQYGTNNPLLNTEYTFIDGINGNTTGLVASVSNNKNTLSYTYDDKGNILTVSEDGIEKVRYAYDGLNELIREDNVYAGKSYTYSYDDGGNITEKKEYAYTTGTLGTVIKTTPYLYGDSNWKDKLTSYDGKTITYDEIGNPLTFDGNTFSWLGRQLDSISGNGKEISYKYNADGIRTEKTVNGKTTKYYLEGSRIILEKDATEERTFWYDGDGKPAAFNIYSAATNGVAVNYYYIYNGQGDVIGLFDQTGAVVCRYYYDAWGKLLKTTDGNGVDKTNDTNFIGYKNPIRYRGYYYDNETKLYYLQSRYYNPEWSRFINADSLIEANGDLISNNLFAYCSNNPIRYADPKGTFVNTIIGGIVGGIVGGISAAINGDNVIAGIGIGAATGALAGFTVDFAVATGGVGAVAIAAAGGAIANSTNYMATELVNGRNIDWKVAGIEATVGAVSNVLSFGVAGGTLKKVSGKPLKNITNNFKKTVMANTTRKVVGHVTYKSAKGVVKNMVKNLATEGLLTGTITGLSISISKIIQYKK